MSEHNGPDDVWQMRSGRLAGGSDSGQTTSRCGGKGWASCCSRVNHEMADKLAFIMGGGRMRWAVITQTWDKWACPTTPGTPQYHNTTIHCNCGHVGVSSHMSYMYVPLADNQTRPGVRIRFSHHPTPVCPFDQQQVSLKCTARNFRSCLSQHLPAQMLFVC